MNKKITIGLGLACLACFQSSYAGGMGRIAPITILDKTLIPFISGEGFPVWYNLGGVIVTRNSVTSSRFNNDVVNGGGRLAAGFIFPYTEHFNFTGETGWNYFGKSAINVAGSNFSTSLSGADLLVGLAYKQNHSEIFAKVGTLFLREHYGFSTPNTYKFTTNTYNYYSSASNQGTLSDFLPEIKFGYTYNFNPNWGASVAYMHAFGASSKIRTTYNTDPASGTIQDSTSSALRVPSLSSVLFGLHYRFA